MTERSFKDDVDRLLRYLSQPELADAEAQWGSEALADNLWKLGEAVFPEALCRACEMVLPDYVYLQVMGKDADSTYPRVRLHLDRCARCAEAHAELARMSAAAYADQLPVAPFSPRFDLAFLSSSTQQADAIQLWQEIELLGKRVARLFAEIQVSVRAGMASFGRLPAPLAPAWITLPAMRDVTPVPEQQAQILPLAAPEHDLSIGLTVGPVAGDQASLSIQITRLSSQQPLARVRVTIRDPLRRILVSEKTRADGRVTFPRVGSGSYVIEVIHAGKALELPMTFTWQA